MHDQGSYSYFFSKRIFISGILRTKQNKRTNILIFNYFLLGSSSSFPRVWGSLLRLCCLLMGILTLVSLLARKAIHRTMATFIAYNTFVIVNAWLAIAASRLLIKLTNRARRATIIRLAGHRTPFFFNHFSSKKITIFFTRCLCEPQAIKLQGLVAILESAMPSSSIKAR